MTEPFRLERIDHVQLALPPGSEEQADVTPDHTITSHAEIPAILSAISEGTGK